MNSGKGDYTLNEQLVRDFITAINEHDSDKICSLMTDDHQFIDSQGNVTDGKEIMKSGWMGYFQLFPDYKIEAVEFFTQGETVAAFGFAGGTFQGLIEHKENVWRLPASWKAVVKNGKILQWQVYADAKIPYDIIKNAMK
ncbi:MAG: nuclear transport factor 2 family protein [Ignavibacteriae bacterium]|nr:MAG: nuclear transport factor 2 family protein [Ignavibacteriota bacterium]